MRLFTLQLGPWESYDFRGISRYTLRIIGPSYRGVWICIAGFRDLQTPSFEIPWFLGPGRYSRITTIVGGCWTTNPSEKMNQKSRIATTQFQPPFGCFLFVVFASFFHLYQKISGWTLWGWMMGIFDDAMLTNPPRNPNISNDIVPRI